MKDVGGDDDGEDDDDDDDHEEEEKKGGGGMLCLMVFVRIMEMTMRLVVMMACLYCMRCDKKSVDGDG
jgi:hypothetical protein